MSSVAHYCQKCLAGNPLGTEFCSRCGTRLMIIVEPAAARYETNEGAAANDEHLLERISALENRIARLSEKLERGLDLLLRQAQNSHFDRALVKSLVGLLTDDGIIQGSRLERLWIDSCQKDAAQQQESERRDDLRAKILAAYRGDDRDAFEASITQGFLFLEEDQPARGIRAMRQAAEMSTDNAPLHCYIGEHFFKTGKLHQARNYLEKAHEILPLDQRVALLLGLTCADEGDTERAKELLASRYASRAIVFRSSLRARQAVRRRRELAQSSPGIQTRPGKQSFSGSALRARLSLLSDLPRLTGRTSSAEGARVGSGLR